MPHTQENISENILEFLSYKVEGRSSLFIAIANVLAMRKKCENPIMMIVVSQMRTKSSIEASAGGQEVVKRLETNLGSDVG